MRKYGSVVVSIILFIVTFAAFSRCRDFGMVNMDDYPYLCNHPLLMSWQGWATVSHAFTPT